MNLISSTLEPEGEKLFINEIMSYAYNDLISKKYDLVFLHVLVPHKPYGFNQNCLYDVKISNLNIYLNDIDETMYGNNDKIDASLNSMNWPLPLVFRAGVSKDVSQSDIHNLTIAADAIHPNNNVEYINIKRYKSSSKKEIMFCTYC